MADQGSSRCSYRELRSSRIGLLLLIAFAFCVAEAPPASSQTTFDASAEAVFVRVLDALATGEADRIAAAVANLDPDDTKLALQAMSPMVEAMDEDGLRDVRRLLHRRLSDSLEVMLVGAVSQPARGGTVYFSIFVERFEQGWMVARVGSNTGLEAFEHLF
ncbi:MAG: hypothetical protein AAGI51_18505 [Pseudomonadota bacterium]